MTRDAITVEGDETLAATTRHAADELADMAGENRAAGEVVRARAASNAPKVSGTLAGSITVQASAVGVVVAATAIYAARINYGWPAGGLAAQPFMTDALADTERAIIDTHGRRVNTVVGGIRGA